MPYCLQCKCAAVAVTSKSLLSMAPNSSIQLISLRPPTVSSQNNLVRGQLRSLGFSKPFCIRSKHKKYQPEYDGQEGEEAKDSGKKGKSTRQRSLKQQLKRKTLSAYQARFAHALQEELNEEMQAVKMRLNEWSRSRLASNGIALFDCSARLDGSLYRDKIVRFYTTTGDGLLPINIQLSQGNIVLISRNNPLVEEESAIEGVVMEKGRRFIKVAIPFSQLKEIDLKGKWRLDLYSNRVAYERSLFAVATFSSPLVEEHGTLCSLSSSNVKTDPKFGWGSEGPIIFGEGAAAIRGLVMKDTGQKWNIPSEQVEDVLPPVKKHTTCLSQNGCENSEEVKVAKSAPSQIGGKSLGAAKYSVREFIRGVGEKLNASQKKAVETAAIQRVTLWQGPPGTGKTKTLSYLISALRKTRGKVLACADSNVAVDNLVERLLELGLSVARVGQPAKVKEELRKCTVDAQVARHPLSKKAEELKKEAREQVKSSSWQKAMDLEARAVKQVVGSADVVASTCIGAGDGALANSSFCVCVIDEATQATEPAALIPILRSKADCIVLVGDPAQLPPTVLSSVGKEEGLEISLFSHLQECGLKPCFLDTQYRMHPEIAALPSDLFYASGLKSHPKPSDRLAPSGFSWPDRIRPIVFMDCVHGAEECIAESNSWLNRVEAAQVLKVLDSLLSQNDIKGGCRGIGIIAPYSAQVRLLQDLIFSNKRHSCDRYEGLEIKTVDGFQGCEKEVMVVCTVRANKGGQLGFVKDPRRMNVALTRAKCGLVVIGNSKTLKSDKNWATWLCEIEKKQLYSVIDSSHVMIGSVGTKQK